MKRLIERRTHKNPRLLVFFGVVLALVVVLTSGLAYRQLFKGGLYSERERLQNLRRVVSPGPRGNIYDRNGRLLVGNRPRFSVVIDLAELRGEFRSEYRIVSRNYSKLPAGERPNGEQLERIARASVTQRYLDKVNVILGRHEQVRSGDLKRHIDRSLLLPYVLIDDLEPEEYARLIERLPVNSPLQVYTSSTRDYPFGTAAAHTLGYVSINSDPEVEDFPGEDLTTFKMKGSLGKTGLEKVYDAQLEGEAGGAIYLVDYAGYKVENVEKRLPVQGHNLSTSIDIDLQLAAEKAMTDANGKDLVGAAVALDIATGEVLVLASKPDFDLNSFVPRLTSADAKEIEESGAWLNRAIQGQYPPGSTFKIITSTAGLRSGALDAATARVNCPGYTFVGKRRFACDEVHGNNVDLNRAIMRSCNVFFYKVGLEMGPTLLAAEAARFGFNEKTGIELPYEFSKPHVASPEWKKAVLKEPWYDGDTANTSIGQGDTLVTPLQVACMVASFARGETRTKPTLIHDSKRPRQHSEPIGLSPSDYNAILQGLQSCYTLGTAKLSKVDGLTGGAKTGTAQKGRIDLAWLVAFAPLENPQIAVAVVMEGTEPDASYHGGTYAAPVVHAILQTWKDKRDRAASQPIDLKTAQR